MDDEAFVGFQLPQTIDSDNLYHIVRYVTHLVVKANVESRKHANEKVSKETLFQGVDKKVKMLIDARKTQPSAGDIERCYIYIQDRRGSDKSEDITLVKLWERYQANNVEMTIVELLKLSEHYRSALIIHLELVEKIANRKMDEIYESDEYKVLESFILSNDDKINDMLNNRLIISHSLVGMKNFLSAKYRNDVDKRPLLKCFGDVN